MAYVVKDGIFIGPGFDEQCARVTPKIVQLFGLVRAAASQEISLPLA